MLRICVILQTWNVNVNETLVTQPCMATAFAIDELMSFNPWKVAICEAALRHFSRRRRVATWSVFLLALCSHETNTNRKMERNGSPLTLSLSVYRYSLRPFSVTGVPLDFVAKLKTTVYEPLRTN